MKTKRRSVLGENVKRGMCSGYGAAMLAIAAVLAGTPAFATEGDGGVYPNGAENFLSGALPPTGTYFLDYLTYYSADKFKDNGGNSVIPDFKVNAVANGFRFLHMTDKQVFGGTWGMHVFVPIAQMDITAFGRKQSKSGLADIVVDPFVVSYHTKNFHYAYALEIFVPTGKYDKNDLANLGRNYWTYEPIIAGTYLSDGGFDASLKLHYDFNTKNKDTEYRSGQEFHADFTAAQKFNDFSLGLGGYYYKQVTDDKQNGVKVGADGNRGRVFGIGPQLKYDHKNI